MRVITIPTAYFEHKARYNMLNRLNDIVFVDGIYLRLLIERKRCLETGAAFTIDEIRENLDGAYVDAACASGFVLAGVGECSVLLEEEAFKLRKSPAIESKQDDGKLTKTEISERLESLYKRYPTRGGAPMGKKAGMTRGLALFKTEDQLSELQRAVENVASMLASGVIAAPHFVPHWGTFINNWTDYLPENTQSKTDDLPF